MKQRDLNKIAQKIFVKQRQESSWKTICLSLVEKPHNTDEFDDLIEIAMNRYANIVEPEYAARIISKTVNILYHQRHPAEHMVLLAAIL